MSDILERLTQLKPASDLLWLKDIQAEGLSILQASEWPSRKTEDWKYTNLKSVATGEYFFSNTEPQVTTDFDLLLKTYQINGLDTYPLVFVNGEFSAELSYQGELPVGVELVTFLSASEEQTQVIQQYLNKVVKTDKHLFSVINNLFLSDGVFLRVKKNTVLKRPLQIVWLTTESRHPVQVTQRMLAVIEDNAEVSLIEQYVSSDQTQNCFTNGVTELHLSSGARMHHYRLHQEQQGALHIGGVHASLNRDAFLNSFHMALGSELKRIDVVINHDGEGAHCMLNGVYLPQQDQHVDYHTCIEHRVPNCTSSENFRGIIGGNGRAVFNGRIHIHPDAQKTLAELSNKNLLTSDKAEVDSKPELEIYADDVKCAHGTTVAQLDELAMHYFQTRGISAKKAEVMLSYGFIKELINEVQHPEIAEYLTPLLAELFAKDPNLASL